MFCAFNLTCSIDVYNLRHSMAIIKLTNTHKPHKYTSSSTMTSLFFFFFFPSFPPPYCVVLVLCERNFVADVDTWKLLGKDGEKTCVRLGVPICFLSTECFACKKEVKKRRCHDFRCCCCCCLPFDIYLYEINSFGAMKICNTKSNEPVEQANEIHIKHCKNKQQ